MDAFRQAVERKDLQAILATLGDDVVFYSPVTATPYHGVEQVGVVLGIILRVFEDFAYQGELLGPAAYGRPDADGGPPTQALVFRARVRGKPVHGLDLITYDEAGRVTELTVMVRPLTATMMLGRIVMAEIAERASAD